MKTRKIKVSVYIDAKLFAQLDKWRAKHMPLIPKTQAIERIIRERIEQDMKEG